jgi:hypothetical protein
VKIEGHPAVGNSAGQWLVVTTGGAAMREDEAFRAAFDVDPVDDGMLLGDPSDTVSPVVTTP